MKKEVISFDLSDMQPGEIRAMFESMPVKSLRTWMEYYEKREQFEICAIIKDVINNKNR